MKKLITTTLCILLISGMAAQISILGTATPAGNWETDFYLTQDSGSPDLWSINIQLNAGELKFRQNGSWDVNWGGSSFPSGTGVPDGPNIPVYPGGSYAITFNTSTLEYNFAFLSGTAMGISHQAVIRNTSGDIVSNQDIGIQISIIQGAPDGTVVYSESHLPHSNINGLISFVIGQGTVVSGEFSAIDWANGPYFIQTEADPEGGANYTIAGTSQVFSVPYAFMAKQSMDNPWLRNGINIYLPNGSVGIGTPGPGYKLDVRGGFTDEGAALSIGNSDASHRLILFGGRENDPNPFIHWKHGDPLRFTTDLDGWSEKMRITSDGWLGIGTDYPQGKFHVTGDDSLRVIFSPAPGTNSLSSGIMLRSTFGGEVPDYTPRNLALIKAHFDGGGWSTASLSFHVAGDDCLTDGESDPCERMRITNEGNVGIGIENPAEKLEVDGNLNMHDHQIKNVADPVNPQDAATKYYVDQLLSIIQTMQNGVKDIDGNHYKVILIGNQLWMAENLKTTMYRNGTPIEYPGTDNDAWINDTVGAYAWYDNEIGWKDMYGALYNWYAVKNTNGLCPAGWGVPSASDWFELENYLTSINSNNIGNQLKSCRQVDSPLGAPCNTTEHPRWNSDLVHHGTDDYGFSGLPGGNRSYLNGLFYGFGNLGYYWSSTFAVINMAWIRSLNHETGDFLQAGFNRNFGINVRCLKGAASEASLPEVITAEVTEITESSAISGGNITSDGGSPVTARGVVWSTNESPSIGINDGITYDGAGTGEFISNLTELLPETTYYVRAYASNSVGTAYGNQMSFSTLSEPSFVCGESTITDIDGNAYNTIQIGDQCWMTENLKTTTYRNENPIWHMASHTAWEYQDVGAYAWYNNDISLKDSYGALYNWLAVNDVSGLCPTAWHIPSFAEWTELRDYVVSQGFPNANSNPISASNALKSCRQIDSPMGDDCNTSEHPRWDSNDTHHGLDVFGFSAHPGGYRYINGAFDNLGDFAGWWSSTEYDATNARSCHIHLDSGIVSIPEALKKHGFSVRCLRD